jgi:hypothetical protein
MIKDLAEDKEYLKYRLISSDSMPGLHKDIWWKSDDTVVSVARILERWGQFKERSEVIDYFEKPYKFENNMKFIVENM